ncbi:MAG TPA: hypothetical protein VE401_09310 [Solirubrobacterales bacterium]|nr:hypothetical protein [Solirubrobacterales bacterium]
MPRLRRSDCSGPGVRRRGRGRGFEYLDEAGNRIEDPEVVDRIAGLGIPPAWRDRSEEVNEYLKSAAGDAFSAKDFRTWYATVVAAVALAAMPVPETKAGRKRRINDAVKGVAAFLGNTPAVCRASYIDPRVFDRYRGGATIAGALRSSGELDEAYMPSAQRRIERAVMCLISS